MLINLCLNCTNQWCHGHLVKSLQYHQKVCTSIVFSLQRNIRNCYSAWHVHVYSRQRLNGEQASQNVPIVFWHVVIYMLCNIQIEFSKQALTCICYSPHSIHFIMQCLDTCRHRLVQCIFPLYIFVANIWDFFIH